MIDLTKPVGNDGLTIQDLLLTLLRELGKHKLMCAGLIIDIDSPKEVRVFGHGSQEAISEMYKMGQSFLETGTITNRSQETQGGN
jgi:hypothetical protein